MKHFLDNHLLQILCRFESQNLPLDLFLSGYFRGHKNLGSHDRKTIAEAVYGMTRWKGLLSFLAGTEHDWEKRHELFKNFNSSIYLNESKIPAHIRVSFPDFLYTLFVSHYGEKRAIELCLIHNTQAPITIRTNPLKIDRNTLLEKLQKNYDVDPCAHAPFGITFKKRIAFFEMQEFKEGFFEVQDEASQLVSMAVQPSSGQQVMDYCSGSGGKTLGFAHLLQGKGQIYLHDVRQTALIQAKKRCLRAGIQNVQILHSEHPHLIKLKKKMDWVLVDAPCSGTGTLRRNPDMKWKFSLSALKNLVKEQRQIFEKALSYLKPNGKIVYATCSILKEENEEQMYHFIKTYDLELTVEPFISLPSMGGMDGFFAATFQRKL